jgi:hypothetical protein
MGNFSFSNISDSMLRRLTDGELFPQEEVQTATCRQCGGTWVHIGDLCLLLHQLKECALVEPKQDLYAGLIDLLTSIRHTPESNQGEE